MLARALITDEVPPLKPSDTCKKVLDWMEDFRLSHLPVVNQREFVGLVSYTDMLDLNDPSKTIDTLQASLLKVSVKEDYHVLDVLKIIADYNLTAVAVVDNNSKYMGVITAVALMQVIAKMPFVHEPGGIITLEINSRDYTLSQIAQIVEGNDAKILNMYINAASQDTTKIEVTLKINKDDLAPILQTFSRYNYTVKAIFHQHDIDNNLRDRYDQFMHFLNI